MGMEMGISFTSCAAQAQPIQEIRRPFLPKPTTTSRQRHFLVSGPIATTPVLYCRSSAEKCPPSSSCVMIAQTGRRTLLMQQLACGFMSMCITMTMTPQVAADTQDGSCSSKGGDMRITDKVFFEISIDREPVGRIVIGLYGEDAPVGSKRFAELAKGNKGVSYRKKEFFKITPSYVQNAGLRSFTLGGDSNTTARFEGGDSAERLIPELEAAKQRCPSSTKNVAGSVSLVVKDASKPPPKAKLVARDGKLEVVEEEVRPDPNGTQFSIVIRDCPELDDSNLVVGRVIDGFNVLNAITSVKVVQDNTTSPYFKAAKLVGDTRAVVAERGFYRPYSKVLITRCGLLDN